MIRHSRPRVSRVGWGLVTVAAVVVLTACAPSAPSSTDAATPRPSVTPSPSSTPPPTETPGTDDASTLVIPDCAGLISDAEVQALTSDPGYVSLPDISEGLPFLLEYGFGPVAGEAFTQAAQSEICGWGIMDSGIVDQVLVAVLSDAERVSLETALADSDFTRTVVGETVRYAHHTEEGISPLYRWYIFQGNVWIANFSSTGYDRFGDAALAAVLEANATA